jgi:hypothetical protein
MPAERRVTAADVLDSRRAARAARADCRAVKWQEGRDEDDREEQKIDRRQQLDLPMVAAAAALVGRLTAHFNDRGFRLARAGGLRALNGNPDRCNGL